MLLLLLLLQHFNYKFWHFKSRPTYCQMLLAFGMQAMPVHSIIEASGQIDDQSHLASCSKWNELWIHGQVSHITSPLYPKTLLLLELDGLAKLIDDRLEIQFDCGSGFLCEFHLNCWIIVKLHLQLASLWHCLVVRGMAGVPIFPISYLHAAPPAAEQMELSKASHSVALVNTVLQVLTSA